MQSPKVTSLPDGTILYGYRIVKTIAQGGFGITYLAIDTTTQQKVVIKENIPGSAATRAVGELAFSLPADETEDAGKGGKQWSINNFIREASILKSIDYEGIVSVITAFHSKSTNTDYYVMPFVESASLATLIKNQNFQATYDWVHFFLCTMLKALLELHKRKLLHRDIKPSNILIREDGLPVLIDFGSTRSMEEGEHTRIVTEYYSPIELTRGYGEGPWTDLYSLAATLYKAITKTHVAPIALRGEKTDDYIPLANKKHLVARYGQKLLSGIDKALSYEAKDRFQSAWEWYEYMEGTPGFQSMDYVIPSVLLVALTERGIISTGGDVTVGEVKKKKPGHPSLPSIENRTEITTEISARKPIRRLSSKRKTWRIILSIVMILCILGATIWYFWAKGEDPLAETYALITGSDAKAPTEEEQQGLPPQPKIKHSNKPLRLITRPNIKLYDKNGNEVREKLPAFGVYYADTSADTPIGYYSIYGQEGDIGKQSPKGYVRTEDVYAWPLNLVMRFTPEGGINSRKKALFFADMESSHQFVRAPQRQRDEIYRQVSEKLSALSKGKQQGNDLRSGVIALEPSFKGSSFLLPVLDYARASDGEKKKSVNYADTFTSTGLVKVAALTLSRKASTAPALPKKKPSINLVFLIDTTKSMTPFIDGVKYAIQKLSKNIQESHSDIELRIGLVAYRDWKWKKSDIGLYNGRDADERVCDFIIHNYTPDRLLSPDEFDKAFKRWASGMDPNHPPFDATSKDSVDLKEELYGGLIEVYSNIPWTDKGSKEREDIRLVYLIGDAPGREPGTREADHLRLDTSDKLWEQRATGNSTGMGKEAIKRLLDSQGIHIRSTFITAKRKKPITEENWTHYLNEGREQFKFFAYKDPGKDSLPEYEEWANVEWHGRTLSDSNLRKEMEALSQKFGEHKANEVLRLITYMGEMDPMSKPDDIRKTIGDAQSTMYKEMSAEGGLFFAAYLDLLSTRSEGDGSIKGWTQDKDDNASETLEPCIVLTRKQFNHLVITLKMKFDQLNKQLEQNDQEDSMLKLFGDINAVMVNHQNTMQTQLDQESIQQIADSLPYPCSFIQDLKTSDGSPADLASLKSKLEQGYNALLQHGNTSENWINDHRDPNGITEQDIIIVPIKLLP